jgi:hypothetical protein
MKAKCNFGFEVNPSLIYIIVSQIVMSHQKLIVSNSRLKVIHGLRAPDVKINEVTLLNVLFYQGDNFIDDILSKEATDTYFFDIELIYLLLFIAELVNANTSKLINICCNDGVQVSIDELRPYILKNELLDLTYAYVEDKKGLMSLFGKASNILEMDDFIKGKEVQHKLKRNIVNTVKGVTFSKIVDVAKVYDINLDTLYKRHSRGYRDDSLVFLKSEKVPSLEEASFHWKFIADGVGYNSAAEACRRLDVKYVTYQARKKMGLTIEQSLGLDLIQDGRKTRGVKFDVGAGVMSIQELSEIHNVPSGTIRNRLNRGANIKQALGIEKIIKGSLLQPTVVYTKKRSAIDLEVDGQSFNNYTALAEKYNIHAHTVRQRIAVYGYTAEEAVKLNGKYKPVDLNGKKYSSMTELAKEYGLTIEILQGRLADGSTLQQALGIELKETKNSIWFEAEHYQSLVDLANKQNIPIGALRSRINSMSLKEAIDAGTLIRNPGRYNETILERDCELANTPAWFYVAKLFIEGRYRHKIGITTDSVSHRLKAEGYKFEIIESITETLIECFYLEQTLLSIFSRKRDLTVTSDMLDGYSEVFNLNQSELDFILKVIKDS